MSDDLKLCAENSARLALECAQLRAKVAAAEALQRKLLDYWPETTEACIGRELRAALASVPTAVGE